MQSIEQITPQITALFQPLHHHLAVISTLAGLTPGAVYVDDPQAPQAGLLWFHSRVYLALPDRAGVEAREKLAAALEWELLPQMRQAGLDGFVLHAEPSEALQEAADWLAPVRAIPALRQHYTCERLAANWRTLIPSGYELRPVDARLLAEPGLAALDWLTEEMVSERPSVEDFLEKSFGVCLVHQHEIVGWCLSEYNVDRRCEVGVATAEAHQRRGLGTVMSLALVEEAFHRGCKQVGWHCWSRNEASGALALRAGFELESEFPVLLVLLSET